MYTQEKKINPNLVKRIEEMVSSRIFMVEHPEMFHTTEEKVFLENLDKELRELLKALH